MKTNMILIILTVNFCPLLYAESIGHRPYELQWAGRTEDYCKPMIDFEKFASWHIETINARAKFSQSQEQLIWGNFTAKLTFQSINPQKKSIIIIKCPTPIKIDKEFDVVRCWIWNNHWSWASWPRRASRVNIFAIFRTSANEIFKVKIGRVPWKGWLLCYRRLASSQIELTRQGTEFLGFRLEGKLYKDDDSIVFFDNFSVLKEQFRPLRFKPRPKRGIDMFDGQSAGMNTGKGKLPFPTRKETILPTNSDKQSESTILRNNNIILCRYVGKDGKLTWRINLEQGPFNGIEFQWEGMSNWIKPCQNGGIYLVSQTGVSIYPKTQKLIAMQRIKKHIETNWLMRANDGSFARAKINYRLWGKTLVIDIISRSGKIASVNYGYGIGFNKPKLITLPYHTYKAQGTPAVVAFGNLSKKEEGGENKPLFFASNTDWYLSNASEICAANGIEGNKVKYDFGVRYYPKTNGKRNYCYERFFLTVATKLKEVLPNIPNPISKWKHITGKKIWRTYGCSHDRSKDYKFWRRMYRYGLREMIVVDHESMWSDLENNPESSTFRIHADPTKGGDEAQKRYTRFLQEELGYIYGPYNSYADITALSPYWHVDHISRKADNQLLLTWDRCYGPKPAWILEPAEQILPKLQSTYHFSAAYCDVHTCWTPSERVDYDYRVPGAGTQAAVFYAYGELFLLEKKYFNGPVYSEGGIHWQYCGLTDGNYAQDGYYDINNNPWLVDFDLYKMHELCCNVGMGYLDMFYCKGEGWGKSQEDWDRICDRFLAATVAFGHPGYLILRPKGAIQYPLRSYYMLQQIQSQYTQAGVKDIRYIDENGEALDTESAIATGAYKRSQIAVLYSDGTIVVSNGSRKERLQSNVFGFKVDLPPNGYIGWNDGKKIYVCSCDDKAGHRYDYAETPEYIFIDGRGKKIRMPKAICSGIGICRIIERNKEYEIIPVNGSNPGFQIKASSAVALDYEGNKIANTKLTKIGNYIYVKPVKKAFSYLLYNEQ